jgi:uncharacterized SAM-binding protein YcdF (DUF218 family)/glycosyltransferase involved in cell wall biosynthesis
MLSGRDIVCISSIDWDFIWQGHQEIMATLAERGNRVLFIENTGVRRPTLRDLPRLRDRLRNWRRGFKGIREERQNLYVYSPLVVPAPYSHVARWINRMLLRGVLARWMRAVGFRRPIVWTFLPTPLARDVIRDLDSELTVYYCIDDFAASSSGAARIFESENTLFRDADLVFVTSEKLRERAACFTPHVHSFPFAVNFDTFERVRTSADSVPEDLGCFERPVIGYVGGVHRWVDQTLLAAAAERLPQATFALIGPVQTDVSVLASTPNVRLLGMRRHADIPKYIKGFDVAVIPYQFSDYTANVYPTKLNEYLAMGVPVVATDLPEISRFRANHGDVVAVATGPDDFVRAIEQALTASTPEDAQRRIAVARENSWPRRIEAMSALIEETLEARRAAGEPWQHRFRRAYRASRGRLVAATTVLVLAFGGLFYTPLLWVIAEPLRVSAPPVPADAVVVFAGGVGESGQAGGGYQERVKQALDLHQQRFAPTMLFSSGFVFAFREAEVMRDLAIANGADPSAIVLETKARNTYENVVYSRDLARAHGWRRVLLVSSPYHMRRAMLTWRRAAPDIEAVPTPVPRSQFYQHAVGASFDQSRGIIHEFAAIVAYWWRGWI